MHIIDRLNDTPNDFDEFLAGIPTIARRIFKHRRKLKEV